VYGNAVPGSERANVLVTSFFEFGDRFSLLTKLNYDSTVTVASEGPGQMGSITVFGAGSPDAAPGQVNPFFMAPAGDPTATREQVNFVALRPDGDYGEERQEGDTFYATSVFEAELVNDWTGTISVALGRTNNTRAAYGVFCEPCANLSLNGTPRANADPNESSFDSQSAIITNFPLTEDNALDVWRGIDGNRTSPDVLDYLYSNDDIINHRNSFEQLQAMAQGSVFSLPAGNVRVAVGAGYMWDRQRIADTNPGNTGNSSVSVQYLEFTLRRSVYSGFAEVYIPVISPDMGIPLANSVDVNISLRHDNYSDFGGTTNPKFAANWEVTPGIRFRGNYAKSFVAPKLRQIGDPDRGFARGAGGASQSGGIDVPVNTYPEVLLLPGCAGATTTCRIGTGVNPGLTRSLGAGLANTEPQLGESWSVGVDFDPEFLPNLSASVTYWNTKFTGATSLPAVELLLYSGALNDRLQICPTGCTDAQIEEFTQVNNGAPFNDVLPATTYFLIDRNLQNLLNFDVAGIDAQVEYEIPTDSIGTFVIGTSITYFTKYDQWIFDKPRFSVLNTSGYNSQFPSVQKRGRAHVGWELGGLSADFFANFTGSYRNYIQTTVEPIILDANGNPAGGGDKVKAGYTFDLNLSYEGESGFMTGKRVYVNVKNLFDQDPPFYNGNTSGIGVGAWGYNGFVSNPLGRIVSLGFSANF
ncbi:MAG: TonB-dependent receptor, partial [Amphiplicatus sp.]